MPSFDARSIYLHFLDRELRESVSAALDETTVFKGLFSSICLAPGFVFCSYSHIWESWQLVQPWHRFIYSLWNEGVLITASDHTSVDEFVATRRELYAHDRPRYPLYFVDKTMAPGNIAPSFQTGASTTRALEVGLRRRVEEAPVIARPTDTQIRRALEHELTNRRERAITATMFAASAGADPHVIGSIRRMISREYTSHYMARCDADILTGLRHIEHFDSLSRGVPQYDVRLFDACLRLAKVRIGGARREAALFDVAEKRGTPAHSLFVGEWTRLVNRLRRAAADPWNTPTVGRAIATIRESTASNTSRSRGSIDFFALSTFLSKLAVKLDPDAQKEEPMPRTRTALFMIATDREWRAFDVVSRDRGLALTPLRLGGVAAWRIGEMSGWDVLVARCEAGSLGAGGSALAASDAFSHIQPDIALMPGIAFGLIPQKQQIGDLLVAKTVRDYETVRLNPASTTERGSTYEAATELLAKARQLAGANERIHFGEVLGGCKLVDNPQFIAELNARFPEAIGGEMEGVGIASAAHRRGIRFLLVKGIVDWGHDKDDGAQDEVARDSIMFCLDLLEYIVV